MKSLKTPSIYWNRPYGWRAGIAYIDRDATAADVIRFEREELDNDLDVPDFLLDELDRQRYKARDVIWVCRTRQHARYYAGPGNGEPYQVEFGLQALIIATDDEPETGYLVLYDASRLEPTILEKYAEYRAMQRQEKNFSH
jgi:hypothetical protein